MQSVIILAASLCLAHASWLPAPVQDTPEVAHAKAAHFAAHAQASHGAGAWGPVPAASGWHGALAGPGHYGAPGAGLHKYGPAPLGHDGRVIDTPEVAHLKAAHIAALHSAQAGAHHGAIAAPLHYGGPGPIAPIAHGYAAAYPKWHGPQAHIQLTHDGQYVVDTPEVQHARAAHFAQYHHAASAAAAAPEEPWGHGSHGGWH